MSDCPPGHCAPVELPSPPRAPRPTTRYRGLTLNLPVDEARLLEAAHAEAVARFRAAFQEPPSLDEFVRYVLHKGLGVVVGVAEPEVPA